MTSTDYKSRISKTLTKITFWQASKNSSATFWGYDDILLKLYVDIAKSGDFSRLIKTGAAGLDQCLVVWEGIIKRQEKETGTNQYNAYFQLMKAYAILMNDYMTIRASLMVVALTNKQEVDSRDGSFIWVNLSNPEDLVWLERKGFKISLESFDKMIASLSAGLRRNENLITKAEMKRKEIERIFEQRKGEEAKGFVELTARLNFQLGWNACDEKITLAVFNQYQKELKAKYSEQEKLNHGRNK